MSAPAWMCSNARAKTIPNCAVILMTARGTIETVMKATQGGAFDYIAKPFELDRMLDTVKRAEASVGQHQDDKDSEIEDLPESEMIGSSPKMVDIYKTVSLVAPTDATVLIEGETGTGKEMIARMIHHNSARSHQPFVPVDCGSIAPSLLESELFGALKGAYTGADRDRMGVFEAANNGTVFLDEIGDMELGFQLNLLRFLQEKEIRPLGSPRGKKVDVRVVAATNRDLQKMVDEGKFREDLWYRLNVVRIILPPLVERRGDVPLLAHYFLKKYNERYGQQAKITESALRALENYSWPGNVRQLQHMIERLVIVTPQGASMTPPCAKPSNLQSPATPRARAWPIPKPTRSGECWRPPAETKAARQKSWESSGRPSTANSNAWHCKVGPITSTDHSKQSN